MPTANAAQGRPTNCSACMQGVTRCGHAHSRNEIDYAAAVSTPLGKLVRVDPRTVWKHEAHDFTPWLAANIEVLGAAIGMDLEKVEQEADCGDFSADIVARDLGRDRIVVIENQLEATDHSHLGQLITYAAVLNATAVIWISREVREEHRQAIDWLNRGDGAETQYFAVVLELLQIDDSKPAVNLRLVASPNDWSRQSKQGPPKGEPTSKGLAYQAFNQRLIDELREIKFTNARAGQPQNWCSFATGITGVTYATAFSQQGLRAEIYFQMPERARNETAYDTLFAQRTVIEQSFGEKLSWERLDGKKACRIACYTQGSIDDLPETLDERRSWLITTLLKFKTVFGPLLIAVTQILPTVTSGVVTDAT